MYELAILIVNFRSPEYTVDCLKSLEKERFSDVEFHVWLLDNASNDESPKIIREAIEENNWSSWVSFYESEDNLGFAGGNNLMLEEAVKTETPPPYILLLNNDTVVHSGCLRYVVNQLKQDPSIGLITCNLLNGDESIQNVARRMPTPVTESLTAFGLPYSLPKFFGWADLEDRGWDRETERREVDWVGGAFMCMPLETARETGLFDTDFFFYGEDIELCYRIRKQGKRIVFDPGSSTTHFGGGSSDVKRVHNRRRQMFHWRGRLLVQRKCFGRFAAGWVHGTYILGFFIRKYRMVLKGKRNTESYQYLNEELFVLTHLGKDL